MMTRALVYVFMIFMVGFASPLLVQQEAAQQEKLPAGDDGKRIKMIRKYIGEAGQLYKSADYAKAGKKIAAAQSLLERAIANGSEEYRNVIEKEYRRVAKAHELLSSKSVTLTELKPMPEKLGTDSSMTEEATEEESTAESSDAISFKGEVAPLLVKHCGKCHVDGSRGKFSMRTFEDLMTQSDGEAVVAGKPRQSEVIQLMEDGTMPPKTDVPSKEIEVIRKWIQQGAKFDSDDEHKTIPISTIEAKEEQDGR